MKIANFLAVALLVGYLLQDTTIAANPNIDYVELTDNSTHAGTRSSRSKLVCVKKEDDILVNAKTEINNNNENQPSWSATAGSIAGSGSTAKWTGRDSAEIKAILSGKSTTTSIDIVDKAEKSGTWDRDPYKTKLDALQKAITAFAESKNADNPITLSGELAFTNAKVDKYNNGEETGQSYSLKSNLKVAMAQIKAESPNIATPWPFIFVKVGVDMAPFSLDLTGNIKYDEQFQNPWIASSITINPSSSVKATVKVLGGAAVGENSAGIQALGSVETSIQSTINFKGEGNKIITDGNYKMGSLVAKYEVKALISVMGAEAEWKFAEGKKEISKDGEEQKIERKVLVEW